MDLLSGDHGNKSEVETIDPLLLDNIGVPYPMPCAENLPPRLPDIPEKQSRDNFTFLIGQLLTYIQIAIKLNIKLSLQFHILISWIHSL